MMRTILLFCLLGLLAPALLGQGDQEIQDNKFEPEFELFILPGGLLGNSVQGILQDSVGFMWFASQAGLHRYNGRDFITFSTEPDNPTTINSDYIEDVYIDSRGHIWVSHWSGGGISHYNPDLGFFTRYIHDPDDPASILPSETNEIIEDADGYIWVGTRMGLCRLDIETGKFKHFLSDPDDPTTLSDGEIRGLYLDKENTLWVATGMPWTADGRGGLNRYIPEHETFQRYVHDPDDPNSIRNNKVRAMYEDSRGNFWVGTAGDGLHTLDRKTGIFTHYPYTDDPSKPCKPFLDNEDPSDAPSFSHITSIFEDRTGRLWITAVAGGINIFDPEAGIYYHYESGPEEGQLQSNFIWQTYQSKDGTIWIASGGEGQAVYKIKQKKLTIPFFEVEALKADGLGDSHGITKDKNGKIWIAMTRDGWSDFSVSTLWIVDRTKPEATQVPFAISSEDPLHLDGSIGSISQDRSGNIWVGTTHGYFIANPDDLTFRLFQPDFVARGDFGIAPVHADNRGQIWVADWGNGVFTYDPSEEKFDRITHNPNIAESLSGPVPFSIFEDSQGNILVGGGTPWYDPNFPLFLDRISPESKSITPLIKETITSGMILNITEDLTKNIWFIDFDEGLFKLNTQNSELRKFSPYNSLLPSGQLHFLTSSPDGNLWLCNEQSIIQMDPASETMSIYNELHGVVPSYNYWNGGTLTEDGEMIIARAGGFHAFYPNDFMSDMEDLLPDLKITGFRLLDDYSSVGKSLSSEVLDAPIWKTSSINLESSQNIFSFSIACFDFDTPEANQLQFMLEGYDRSWRRDLRDGETPYYVNVRPGNYTFRVRGANSLGVWDKEGISLGVTINPPWYMTWWAYILYGLLLILVIYVTDRVQRRRLLLKEQKKSQEKELAHAREVEKAYTELKNTQQQLIHSEKMASLGELTAGIAHEIQNPLNFVNNFSEVNAELIDELTEEIEGGNWEEVKALARDLKNNEEKIIHHGKRADSIVKSMLLHSRGGKGEKELIDLNVLCDEYLRLAYHGLRAKDKSFDAHFEFVPDPDLPKAKVVPQDIGRVLLNLINNAFHAVSSDRAKEQAEYLQPATQAASAAKENQTDYASGGSFNPSRKPLVVVKTGKKGKNILISVSDNGPGIPDDIREKIFQPFFTTKASGVGTGLGLSMSYDIITNGYGGTLKVSSEVGRGTEFIITLPF